MPNLRNKTTLAATSIMTTTKLLLSLYASVNQRIKRKQGGRERKF